MSVAEGQYLAKLTLDILKLSPASSIIVLLHQEVWCPFTQSSYNIIVMHLVNYRLVHGMVTFTLQLKTTLGQSVMRHGINQSQNLTLTDLTSLVSKFAGSHYEYMSRKTVEVIGL